MHIELYTSPSQLIPKYTGFVGNENADELYKNATATIPMSPHCHIRNFVIRNFIKKNGDHKILKEDPKAETVKRLPKKIMSLTGTKSER